MKHKHAELMLHYAQDAMTTAYPWELWEGRSTLTRSSRDGTSEEWYTLKSDPVWSKRHEYRRKPNPTLKVYTVHCTLPIKALSPEKASWQFRELLTSGMGTVLVTDENGVYHEMMGIRPKGEQQ